MEHFILMLEEILTVIVEVGAIVLELGGIFACIYTAVKGFLTWLKNPSEEVEIEDGLSNALEFLMCGEILKTVVAHNMSDYIGLAAIVAIRAALAIELHWEKKNKQAEHEHHVNH